jgi:hypothetical protein
VCRYPQPLQIDGTRFIPIPQDLLSALSLSDEALSPPPTTASLFSEYEPLQQNNERAANPNQDRSSVPFASAIMSSFDNHPGNHPGNYPGNHPGTQPSQSGQQLNKPGLAEDILTSRLTVKGLTNLASYPNPMQKAAQDTLAKAKAVDLGLNLPGTAPSSQSTTPDFTKGWNTNTYNPYGPPRAPVGPPEPLKAGQRPFKPALDLAARRALAESPFPPMPAQQPRLPTDIYGHFPAGLAPPTGPRGWDPSLYRPAQPTMVERQDSPALRGGLGPTAGPARLTTPIPMNMPPAQPVPTQSAPGIIKKRKVWDTLPPERIQQYYPEGFPADYDGQYTPIREDWHTKYPLPEPGVPPADWHAKLDQKWYDDPAKLMQNASQIAQDYNTNYPQKNVGVIGQERQNLDATKVRNPWMSAEKVNKMDHAEIVKPLLDMTFTTLVSYKKGTPAAAQNPWADRLVKAEPESIDDSEEGKKSLFSTPNEQTEAQGQAPKTSDRGY